TVLSQGNQWRIRVAQVVAETDDFRHATEVLAKGDSPRPVTKFSMVEEAALDIEGRLESEIVKELFHQTMHGVARQTYSIRADLPVVTNDQYLLAEIEQGERLDAALRS